MLQEGLREQTNRNDGPQVTAYLASIGLKAGYPYCAAGQYYCFWQAARELGLPLSAIPIKRSALASEIFNHARSIGTPTQYRARLHDLIIWRRPGSYRGHIERVIAGGKAGWVTTIGFNTSPAFKSSQDDGQGVFRRKRNIYHPIGRLLIKGLIGFKSS
jgi:hypothetical protein